MALQGHASFYDTFLFPASGSNLSCCMFRFLYIYAYIASHKLFSFPLQLVAATIHPKCPHMKMTTYCDSRMTLYKSAKEMTA